MPYTSLSPDKPGKSNLSSRILTPYVLRPGRSKVDYDNVLADSEREAVADLLNYLENVRITRPPTPMLEHRSQRKLEINIC